MDERRCIASIIEDTSASMLSQPKNHPPLFSLIVKSSLPPPSRPSFPLSSSNWPMMVAANLNLMLAFNQRQNFFANLQRPMLDSPQPLPPCSSQLSKSFHQVPCSTRSKAKSLSHSSNAHTKNKISTEAKPEVKSSRTILTKKSFKLMESKSMKTQAISPNRQCSFFELAVGIKPMNDKHPFSVYSICPATHNNADNKTQKEVSGPCSSSTVAFQAVLYDGEQDLNSGDKIAIPTDLLEICHKSGSLTEANYCPSGGSVLRRIRRGEELVALHVPDGIDVKTMSEEEKKKAAKTFSSSHLVKNLLKPKNKCRQEKSWSSSDGIDLEKEVNCVREQETESTMDDVVKEEKDHEKLPGYQCQRCGKMFSYAYYRSFEKRDRLRIHRLHVHENHRPHVCSVCGKAFSQSSSLNKHLRVHSGERPYHCPHCTKAFTASSILRTHIRQHSGEKPFKCAFCGKSFASHAAHDSHVRRTHTTQA